MQTKNLGRLNTGRVETFIIMLLAVASILVFLLVIPYFVKPRARASKISCIANLLQLDSAKQQWCVECKKLDSDVPAAGDIYGAKLYMRAEPPCPYGGTYTLNAVSVYPTCSLGVTNKSHRLVPVVPVVPRARGGK